MSLDIAHLIKLSLTASILLLVFALGLQASFRDATTLFREFLQPPNRLLRALVSLFLIVPLVAVLVAKLFDLPVAVRAAILAMAVSPIPPILPGKQLKFGGSADFVFGLLVAISLMSVVVVPVGVNFIGQLFGADTEFGPDDMAKLIGSTILLPLVAGLTLRELAPPVAQRVAPWASRLGTVLLLAAIVPVLIKAWPAVMSLLGDGAILAIGTVVTVAIIAGHVLGGSDDDDRTTLAIASAMRHPGAALVIATTNVADEPSIPAAIILYVLVAAIATTLYGAVRKKQLARVG
jgi:BASS family bile acid:Na+ symporter